MNDLLGAAFVTVLLITCPHPVFALVLAAVLFLPMAVRLWIVEGTLKRRMGNRLRLRLRLPGRRG